jgi:serine/threonine protein kinase
MSELPSIPGYRVLNLLGSGAFADVFLAEDESVGRRVAIKLLREQTPNAAQLDRFRREREALASLSHPHLLRVHAAGSVRGRPYVVTELLAGRTLHDLLKETRDQERLLDLLHQAALGVAALHEAGLVHRDIKPENLLLDEGGEVKVADLGLVGGQDLRTLTTDGAIIGTPAYMSPEMCKGSGTREPTSDVYSLGAILYEVLTGQLPHPAATVPALLLMRLAVPNPDPALLVPGLPPALAALCRRAMEVSPQDRWPDAAAFAEALTAARAEQAAPERSLFPLLVVLVGLTGLVVASGWSPLEPSSPASASASSSPMSSPRSSPGGSSAPAGGTQAAALDLDRLRVRLLEGGAEPLALALEWIAANPGRVETAARLRDFARAGILAGPPTRTLKIELQSPRHTPFVELLEERLLWGERCSEYCDRQHASPSRVRLIEPGGEVRALKWAGYHVTARDRQGRFWAASSEGGRHVLYQRFGLEFDLVFDLPGRCTALASRGDAVVCGLWDGRVLRPRLRPGQPTWEQRVHEGRVVALSWSEARLVSMGFGPRPFLLLNEATGETLTPDFRLPTLGALRWGQRLERPEEYLLCVDGLNVVHGVSPDGTYRRFIGQERLNPSRPSGQAFPWSPDGTTPRGAVRLGGLIVSIGSQRLAGQRDSQRRIFERRSGVEVVARRDTRVDYCTIALQLDPPCLAIASSIGKTGSGRIQIWRFPAELGAK